MMSSKGFLLAQHKLVLAISLILFVAGVLVFANTPTGFQTKQSSAQVLIGMWHLNEGKGTVAKDSSGNSNDGTVIDTASWARDGKVSNALKSSWADKKGYVVVKKSSIFDLKGPFSLDLWVKPRTVTPPQTNYGAQYSIVGNYDSTYGRGYDIIFSHANVPGKVVFRVGYGDPSNSALRGSVSAGSKTSLVVGKWYHIVGVYDGSYVKLYINDYLEAQTPMSQTPSISPNAFTIGKGADGYYGWFDGTIDEVKFYKGAYTQGGTTKPTVFVTHSPANPKTKENVEMRATATSSIAIKEIKINSEMGALRRTCSGSPCVTYALLGKGTYTYYAEAKDVNGNVGRDPEIGTKRLTVS